MSKTVQWLFVDLNSYFASVEQEVHPEYRGKPLAVLPTIAETTSCIAASVEAKKFGVKTGVMVRDARRMCPKIIFVEADHKHYVEYHNRIVEAVESCHPVHAIMSIDEVALKLRGRDQNLENALKLASDIREKIFAVGSQLGCSIGISTNKLLSKVASDMQKPNGLAVILKEDIPKKLLTLKLRDFPGIGERMEERLKLKNIFTVQDMYNQDQKMMKTVWGGIVGERYYHWIRGNDLEESAKGNTKSINRSHVLSPELRNAEGSWGIAQKLLHKAGIALRRDGYWAQGMYVSVRYIDQTKWSEEVRMQDCQDVHSLNQILMNMWKERNKYGTPLKVSVTLFDLITEEERTLSFFENTNRNKLSHAMDALNLKYGKNLIYLAGMHATKKGAPTRIAFSNIPDFSIDEEKD
jgi:DNA polymerase-4